MVNRRPTYRISEDEDETRLVDKFKALLKKLPNKLKKGDKGEKDEILGNAQYAILPEGEKLVGWNKEEKEELDDLVRHMLHSRRAKFKRSMKGFLQYVRRRELNFSLLLILTNKNSQLLDYLLRFMPP